MNPFVMKNKSKNKKNKLEKVFMTDTAEGYYIYNIKTSHWLRKKIPIHKPAKGKHKWVSFQIM